MANIQDPHTKISYYTGEGPRHYEVFGKGPSCDCIYRATLHLCMRHSKNPMRDVCFGTKTKEGHYILLQGFFSVCQQQSLHIKTEKCEFVKKAMEYLGFDVGCG